MTHPVRFFILFALDDVLAGGLARAFPLLADPFVEENGG